MNKTLSNVVANGGYITSVELENLVQNYPNLPVVIKFGCSPRELLPMKDVASRIKTAQRAGDYVREVFLSAQTLDIINTVRG